MPTMSPAQWHVVSQTAPGRPWHQEAVYRPPAEGDARQLDTSRADAEAHAQVMRQTGTLAKVIRIGGA